MTTMLAAPSNLPCTLSALLESLGAHAAEGGLATIEAACRIRLRTRPHLLLERVALALCLSASEQEDVALIEWDEAVHQAERLGDWEILEGCLALMGRQHPREALSVLEALSVELPPMTRAWLQANLLAELGEEAAAEETVLAALATPWRARSYVRERPPAYGRARVDARCDPGHQQAADPLLSWIPDGGISCPPEGGTDGTEGQHGTLDPLALRVG